MPFVPIGIAPDLLQQLTVSDDLAAVADEGLENVVLRRRQRELPSRKKDAAAGQVDFEGTDAEDGLFLAGKDLSEDGPHPRQQFADAEGFGDVVVGSGVEGGDLLSLPVPDGENDEGDLGPAPDLFDELPAVAVGKAQIEDDQVGPDLQHPGESLAGRRGLENLVTLGLKGEGQETADRPFVVDDEDADAFDLHGSITPGRRIVMAVPPP